MAKVHIRYKDWIGKFKVAVSHEIYTPCLFGLDLINYIKTDRITTHSQTEKKENLYGNSEVPEEDINVSQSPELVGNVDIMKPQKKSFKSEQENDFSLQQSCNAVKEEPVISK